MKFYSIINLNLENSPYRAEDLSMVYDKMVTAITKWQGSKLESLEFSLANPHLWENILTIKEKLDQAKIPLSFGSLISPDQILNFKYNLQNNISEKIEVFAPCFDENLKLVIDSDPFVKEHINYLPGISSKEDLDEILDMGLKPSRVKIFPINLETTEDFISVMRGPYPELRQERFSSRMITPSQEMIEKYDVYSKYTKNEKVTLITSPREYQRIRNQFLIDASMKLLVKIEKRDLNELTSYVKEKLPEAEILLTGFANKKETMVETLKNANVQYFATRMFKAIVMDLLSGSIDDVTAGELIANELDQYSLIPA